MNFIQSTIIRKNENINDDENREKRRDGSGKVSGISAKMEKIFRAAFRKNNGNQSRQRRLPETSGKLNEDEIVTKNLNKREKLIEQVHGLVNFDYSFDDNYGSCTNLINGKTKSNEINYESENKDEGKNNLNSNKKILRKLIPSGEIKCEELASTAMSVIVDIHCENSNVKSPKNIEKFIGNISSDDHELEQQSPSINDRYQQSIDYSIEKSIESIKRQRKRWSKQTNVILPPKRNSLSLINVPERNNTWMEVTATLQPIAAQRQKKIINYNEEENNFGLNNENFVLESDDVDQVLTIETEYSSAEKTKIGMRSVGSESDEFPTKRNISMDTEEFIERSEISNIEEIQKSSIENTIIKHEISSEIESRSFNKPESDSVSSTQQKKASRRYFKDISMTEKSTSSMSNMRVIDRCHRRKKINTRKENEQRIRSASINCNSTTSETSQSMRKSNKSKKKVKQQKGKIDEIKYISISIHRADVLVPNYIIRHAMVIVHIVDSSTGNYLKYENKNNTSVEYLQPLITGIFDFEANKSIIPYWDEELIFEYDFKTILNAEKNKKLILFEIVDLPSVVDASSTYDKFGGYNCWYKIAWAFLKPLSVTGMSHVDKVVRLQLYRPMKSLKIIKSHHCEPYNWWKYGLREKYPSTLFVTVTSIDPPKLDPIFYGDITFNEVADEQMGTPKSSVVTTETGNISRWSRLAAQSCKVPNEIFFKTEVSENGCFYVAFSNNGKYLASANYDEYDYPIVIYKINEEKVYVKLLGHKSFIYALDWSNNDEMLLSVSSDQTARIWDIKNKIIHEINILPHPSYVYCGKFNSNNLCLIVTGCYDRVIRLWVRRKSSPIYELFQELEGHEGFVNSICFFKNGDFLTADSVGTIVHWTIKKKKGKLSQDWQIMKKIKIREIKNVTINTIVLHSLGSRLLVHSRDNGLRMVDLTTGVVLQKYEGLKNLRIQTIARISPCGGLLLCGGEDATLNIWSVETCKHIAQYSTNLPNAAVTCVDYHPYDHILVYSIFGIASETIVLRYNKQSLGDLIGLKLFSTMDDHTIHGINDTLMKHRIESTQRVLRTNMSDCEKLRNVKRRQTARLVTNESREELRFKLKMINDFEGQLKIRSTNRLTSIIEKIDKILSNSGSTRRSPYDIEANNLGEATYYQEKINSPTESHTIVTVGQYVPSLFSVLKDNSTWETKSDTIEMRDMSSKKNTILRRANRRKSKSARSYQAASQRHYDLDEISKTMSDSAVIGMKSHKKFNTSHNKSEIDKHRSIKMVEESLISNTRPLSFNDEYDQSCAESDGTYVIEKSDIEEIIKTESSSLRSDVTFVIQSEKPVLKSRKKRMEQQTIVQIER